LWAQNNSLTPQMHAPSKEENLAPATRKKTPKKTKEEEFLYEVLEEDAT
jgi:hypothetical protein